MAARAARCTSPTFRSACWAPTGSSPMACRSPWARPMRRSCRDGAAMTACFFGDGAINRGPFLESLNWARVYRLPVLFVCEDNRWSATTASGPMTAGAGAAARALGVGIPAVTGRWQRRAGGARGGRRGWCTRCAAAPVRAAARDHVSRQRPRLGRSGRYRNRGANSKRALETDPIARARRQFLALPGNAGANNSIALERRSAASEVAAALVAADAAPWPDPAAAYADVQTQEPANGGDDLRAGRRPGAGARDGGRSGRGGAG